LVWLEMFEDLLGLDLFGKSLSSGSLSSSSDSGDMVTGFVAAGIAVLGFGSNFVPAKKIYSGDGIFFQWAMCSAIWIVGLCVYIYQGFPKFEPLAMLGGALWCTGNVMAVPIINMVGLAIGMSIWCVANMITGWASGTFGWLGVNKQEVKNPILNYIGVGVAAVSIVLFACIKEDPKDKEGDDKDGEEDSVGEPLLKGNVQQKSKNEEEQEEDRMARCTKKMNPVVRRVIGFIMAIVSGFFYGTNFNPPQYRMEHGPAGTSQDVLDYVFPHFTGIFCASTFFVIVYCIVSCNSPTVYRRAMLPGLASGSIWAVAQVSWFIANKNLSFPISFPIITSGPAVIATLWGVLLFHEIRSKKSIIMLAIALVITITGVVLIALSKFISFGSE